MIKRALTLLIILFVAVGFSGVAGAELTVVGKAAYNGKEYNLIYDKDQEVIWLDYTNHGNRWPQQAAWAIGLNEPGELTYTLNSGTRISWKGDWRLPKTADGARRYGHDGTTTAGFNITTSEMGYLYYNALGNKGYYDTKGKAGKGWFPDSDWGLKNTEPFENLKPDMYWSGTEYAVFPQHAWSFNFAFGDQSNLAFKSSYPYCGMAVRPGTVTVDAAP